MNCFACGKRLGRNPAFVALVDTRDGQIVYIGTECFKLVKASGDNGYQPPLGGPRLWTIPIRRVIYGRVTHMARWVLRLLMVGR